MSEDRKQLQISESNGKTTIVFRKAKLRGKATQAEVLDTILIAAKMQAEYYIKKLSLGAPLDNSEVKALKELAEITKLEIQPKEEIEQYQQPPMDSLKKTLLTALSEKLQAKQSGEENN